MIWVHLNNSNIVDEVARVNPYTIFYPEYASTFIEAPDYVGDGWSLTDGTWTPPPPPDYSAQNAALATSLLQQTDWTTIPAVSDPALSNPYLTNSTEFALWRSQVRDVALNPPSSGPWTPPEEPVPAWSSAPTN